MENQIVIESPQGAFHAYIARTAKLPAPAVVVLQELFGVNADVRATCDELANQGFIAIAPDLFWRQEPGVDLNVTSASPTLRFEVYAPILEVSIEARMSASGHFRPTQPVVTAGRCLFRPESGLAAGLASTARCA